MNFTVYLLRRKAFRLLKLNVTSMLMVCCSSYYNFTVSGGHSIKHLDSDVKNTWARWPLYFGPPGFSVSPWDAFIGPQKYSSG